MPSQPTHSRAIVLNLRQIRYFVAVYEEGSFSAAAKRENCTQPGLSTHIRQLEESLAATLFERSVRGVRPTVAGRQFYGDAVLILKSVQAARQHLAELSGDVAGTVTAGLIPSVMRGLLPALLPAFVDAYPHIRLSLSEAYSGTLTAWVLSGDVDFAVVIDPPNHAGLEIETISREKMVLISGGALKLAPWEPVKIAAMPPLNLVLPSPRHGLRANLDRVIAAGEIKVARMVEMDSMQGSIEFIRNSNWATVLPFTAVTGDAGARSLCFNPIVEPEILCNFYLIHLIQKPLSAAAHVLVDALELELRASADAWRGFVTAGK